VWGKKKKGEKEGGERDAILVPFTPGRLWALEKPHAPGEGPSLALSLNPPCKKAGFTITPEKSYD